MTVHQRIAATKVVMLLLVVALVILIANLP